MDVISKTIDIDTFEVNGILRDFVELENETDEITSKGNSMKNALEIQKWCLENYGNKKKYERKLPSPTAKDEYEKRLGKKLSKLRQKIKQYEAIELSKIEDEEDRKIVEIIRNLDKEYGLGDSLKNALEIQEWGLENYGEKKKYERKLPSSTAKDEYEKRLGKKLINLRIKIKQYEGIELSKIEDEEDRKIVEIIRNLDEEYNPRKLKSKDVGVAGLGASVEECDKADDILSNLIENTKEGGITQSE